MIKAVVFDLDGVLIDSEQLWDEVRREVAEEHDRPWPAGATAAMQGMSSPEWSQYMVDEIGLDRSAGEISEIVVAKLFDRYETAGVPFIAGAIEAVQKIGARWPLALASSSNRAVIDRVLEIGEISDMFTATVSSEEVDRGKPAPDVYLEAVRRLGEPPSRCAAVEDSANGIRSAVAGGLAVVAIPNEHFPPSDAILSSAAAVVESIRQITPEVFDKLGVDGRLDEAEIESFPASDAHSDWAGPLG